MLGQSEIRKWLIRLRQIVVIARNEFLGPTVGRMKKRCAEGHPPAIEGGCDQRTCFKL
jgi:hypothetical protein